MNLSQLEQMAALKEAYLTKAVYDEARYDRSCSHLERAVREGKCDREASAFLADSVLNEIAFLERNAKKVRESYGLFLRRFAPSVGPIPEEVTQEYAEGVVAAMARGY